jgi:hypothetical protein
MAPNRTKRTAKPSIIVPNISTTSATRYSPDPITLGDEKVEDLALPTPQYPSPPSIPSETNPSLPTSTPIKALREEEEDEDEKGAKLLIWSAEMIEQLVETLLDIFTSGGGANNSFKKTSFERAATAVRRAYTGPLSITWQKCKNKWQDLKAKWAHWIILSQQSSGGFNKDKELFEFFDPVWQSLNEAHPKIIWHKKNVMPYREELGLILSNVQAKGQETFTLKTPTPSNLDPRLSHTSTSLSPAPSKVLQATKSKGKRVKEEDDSDDRTLAPRARRKVDIGLAIIAFSKELARARKAKEIYLTDQQKAV